ncbi:MULTISPECIES: hypothetical protein [unclassified Streptomyces]
MTLTAVAEPTKSWLTLILMEPVRHLLLAAFPRVALARVERREGSER